VRQSWLVALPLVLIACGAANTGTPPAELLGAYTMTLVEADLPDSPPPELADGLGAWELTIANAGGPDDGPVLTLVHSKLGNLESPSLRVDGDRLLLNDEECAAGGTLASYDNAYRWVLTGSTLTITTITNECSDRVAETILTSHPWTKQT
jgi:hypothetical protein